MRTDSNLYRSLRAACCLCVLIGTSAAWADSSSGARTLHVSGTGTDRQDGALVHSKTTTATGETQTSTEIIELEGDLKGKVLYQVTTVIDAKNNTLVDTGRQVFSGTIAGSEPVLIYDSKFHFDANLTTGKVAETCPSISPSLVPESAANCMRSVPAKMPPAIRSSNTKARAVCLADEVSFEGQRALLHQRHPSAITVLMV